MKLRYTCRKVLLVGINVVLPWMVGATTPENQAWPSFVIEKPTKTGVKIRYEQQLRLRSQSPVFKETFSEFQFGYPLSSNLGATLYYRHIFYADDTAWRVAASVQARSLLGVNGLNVRLKLQRQQRQGSQPAYHARYRGELSLRSPAPWPALYFQAEPWLLLAEQPYHSRIRLTAGMKRRMLARFVGELFLRLQLDLKDQTWCPTRILGLRCIMAL